MDDGNKILDVTYGTFSCRLEGFDDSVETMKTVVSFFHDLAGHDRFMDVDPLAPDMETLARLTEDQSGADVDVEGDGKKVSLRVRKDDVEEERPSLRVTRPIFHMDAEVEEDLYDDVAAFEDDLGSGSDHESAQADDAASDVSEDYEDSPVEIEPVDVDASVADKLQRIRAVVGRGHLRETDEAFAEDLSQADETPVAANPLAQRLAELAARNSEIVRDAVAEDSDIATEQDADSTDDELTDSDALEEEDTAAELQDAPVVSDEHTLADDEADALDEQADNDEPDLSEAELEDLELQVDVIASDEDIMALDGASQDDADDSDEATLDDVAEDADVAADEDESADVNAGPLILTSADETSDDDDDDDFNLHDEVAKVEAEIASRRGNEVARHGLPRSVDSAMSRILSQTDQHLNQPESRRHRDAFAQLKAAVAATEAARQLGDPGGKTRDSEDDFKDDLGAHDAEEKAEASAPAATPLKLVVSTSDDQDPVENAQEADADHGAVEPAKQTDAASDRLRQIAAKKEAEDAPSPSRFADFAKEQGATDLVDLLEAAAAYISFVEGDEDFSRPQVMKKVQSASAEEVTREDGLRSFGRLLRQSKIIKLNNGRFQVSGNSRFRPDGDKAAQG